jgi:hypothetical protein
MLISSLNSVSFIYFFWESFEHLPTFVILMSIFKLKTQIVKFQLSCSFCTLLSLSVFAQFPGAGGNQAPVIKGKIEGKVVDSLTRQPVGFATISLKKKGSTILQDGVLSEENGTFKFENVVKGSYDIYFSFLGYTAKRK